MPPPPERKFISPDEAAAVLGLNTREVYRFISAGQLPASRLSHKAIRISVADLDQFVESHRIGNQDVA